jgi:hypothetical protein
MKRKFSLRRILLTGLLVAGLLGLLGIFFNLTGNLPSQIYSEAQLEFLSRNYLKSVYQVAPILNAVGAEGLVEAMTLPWKANRVRAKLTAHYEEFKDVSATVYDLEFLGEYLLDSPDGMDSAIELYFPFPEHLETLHEVRFLVDGEEPAGVEYSTQGIRWRAELEPDVEHRITIQYCADGANTFTYALPYDQRSDLDIVVTVSGLTGSTIPRDSLPATAIEVNGDGETIIWNYNYLIADRNIQIALPTQLSFTQRVAQLQDDFRALASLAPFLVGFCLLSLVGVFHLSHIRLNLESYLLVGCGLALFYPMLTLLSGLIEVTPAAALSITTITALILLFLRLATGERRTVWRAALILLVFLGIFSLGMLTPWRGILLTGGGLLLLGIFMILYARRPAAPEPEPPAAHVEIPPQDEGDEPLEEPPSEVETKHYPGETRISSAVFHCPYCGREMMEEYSFCPACGQDAAQIHRCAACGHEQFVPTELETVYCLQCGQALS